MASAAATTTTTTTPSLQAPIRPISSAAPSTLTISSSAATPTPAPPGSPSSGIKIILVAPCSAWACWSRSQKDAVIAISALIGLAFVAILIYIYRVHRKRAKRLAELEKGPDFVDERRRMGKGSRSRSRGLSLKGRWKGKERERGSVSRRRGGIEGLENIEMGPAVARSLIESGVLNPTAGVTSTGGVGEEKRFEGGEYRMSGGLSPREGEKGVVLDQSDIHPLKREEKLPEVMKEAGMAWDDQAWKWEGDGKGSQDGNG
ncbi:hypothetical protein JMJ35_006161 [Cladonia borealis]|uniref:Uncharacterized protein n=1 Tax=Cladonia borealis TaxID=184061 RepID=A0AA39V0W5_9LECA|nr:hypothetical protein JMJ35_006161 [Cladonia borealis]